MSNRASANIALTILTSVLTSAVVTVGILYYNGTLRLPNSAPESVSAPISKEVSSEAKTIETPLLKGLTTKLAADVLKARGLLLVVQEEIADDSVPKGHICKQDPLPDSSLTAGGTVTVVVSTGPKAASVPDVAGKPLDEAKQILAEVGFKIGDIIESDTGTPGTVVSTSPQQGTPTSPNTTVNITVTTAVTVPKVVGMYFSKGKKIIKDAGFKLGKTGWRYKDRYDSNIILSQKPKANSVVVPGTEITLVVNAD